MPLSCPFMCSRAWLITSCKLPASSWKPHTATGCKHKQRVNGAATTVRDNQRHTEGVSAAVPQLRCPPFSSFFSSSADSSWVAARSWRSDSPSTTLCTPSAQNKHVLEPLCAAARVVWQQSRLTSTKKMRFSNNEGWVFNLPSLVSSKSPLHLLRMSAGEKRKAQWNEQKREEVLNSGL